MTRRLSRATDQRPAAPVRHLHLGAGNFFRAHQAFYTAHAADADQWGIAAFTGRSAEVAEQLAPAEGLYVLDVQDADGDHPEVIGVLSAVHAADDLVAWRGYFADPALAIVTSTITEFGYVRDADGGVDLDDERIRADLRRLRSKDADLVTTAPAKFVLGLLARRAAGAGPLTFVPCDNVPDNGTMLARVIGDLAAEVDDSLPGWIAENVAFVTTMVDRITPRATAADRERLAAEQGLDDPALVVTEPFTEWVLAGEFAAGRPRWEDAGARFVDDVAPFETRKLWLLNGSHSLLAYAGSIRGHETVFEAIGDDVVRGWVEQWWDAAAPFLSLPASEIADYRAALLERYRNPRIRHLLAQIAADGSQKLPIRTVPVLRRALAVGHDPAGATRTVAAWVCHLRGQGAPVQDADEARVRALAGGDLGDAVANVLGFLGVEDDRARSLTEAQAREFASRAG